MKNTVILNLIWFAIAVPAFAQIEGTVINHKDKPAKNVKIWRKHTMESVKTDNEGKFSFGDVSSADTLVVTMNKKYEAVFAVGNLKNVEIRLGKNNYTINESGCKPETFDYHRSFRPASSNVLVREQIERMSANSLYDLLRSSIPGVTVSEGVFGSVITIRGGSSLESDNEPLFIVDGTTYESSSDVDRQISVRDIERIEVDKDGGGYGAKGSNGVIIITTAKN